VAPRSFGVVVLVTMLDVAVARHSPISLKIASGKNLCVAFTSLPMFYVSAVKIMKSFFLFFAASISNLLV
jgi:hypothetical protein